MLAGIHYVRCAAGSIFLPTSGLERGCLQTGGNALMKSLVNTLLDVAGQSIQADVN